LTSIAILPSPPARTAFIIAGLAVELVGIVFVFRAHMPPKQERG
jgi:hypothetical protein